MMTNANLPVLSPHEFTHLQDIGFIEDLTLLLENKKSGHLAHYHYSEPSYPGDLVNGAALWDRVITHSPAYYQFEAENSVLPNVAEFISTLLSTDESSVIDLGPGSGKSLPRKTYPFLAEIQNIENYIPVDICGDYLNQIRNDIGTNFFDINVSAQQKNYFESSVNFNVNTTPVFLFLSSSVSNLPEINLSGSYAINLAKILVHFYEVMQRQGYLVISHDTTQDEAELIKAYSDRHHVEFSLNLLEKIKRDTPNYSNPMFDPAMWAYKPVWCSAKQCIKHTVYNEAPQAIILKGKTYRLPVGTELVLDNSHKYKAEDFLTIAQQGGFRPVKTFMDHSDKVAVHILERHE
jgi:uncharacterized SAM-dependent methyltransferase